MARAQPAIKSIEKESLMSTVAPVDTVPADARVQAVFADIRAKRGSDFINHFWRYLAFDPALLESTWAEVKRVMATPSALDPLTKEMLYRRVGGQRLRLLRAFAHRRRARQGHDARAARRTAVHHWPGRAHQPPGDGASGAGGRGL